MAINIIIIITIVVAIIVIIILIINNIIIVVVVVDMLAYHWVLCNPGRRCERMRWQVCDSIS